MTRSRQQVSATGRTPLIDWALTPRADGGGGGGGGGGGQEKDGVRSKSERGMRFLVIKNRDSGFLKEH
jgi:hypothetical protein